MKVSIVIPLKIKSLQNTIHVTKLKTKEEYCNIFFTLAGLKSARL